MHACTMLPAHISPMLYKEMADRVQQNMPLLQGITGGVGSISKI